MQVIFIHHSCFLIEVDEKVLIFDYFGGDRLNGFAFHGTIPTYEPDTPVYVFASNAHKDHFDPEVLTWAERYTNIHYVFSKEIRFKEALRELPTIDPAVKKRITSVTPDHKYEVDGLSITTLRSTQTGVAFYVTTNGVSIFFAGDLNDWYYEGVGDLINGRMTRNFRFEIRKLKDKPLNLAFIPMDPKLGDNMYRSVDYLLRNTDAEFVFPMHMWQDYSGIASYKKRISNLGFADRVIDISRENQVFAFGD